MNMKKKMLDVASTLLLCVIVMALAWLLIYVPSLTAVHK